MTNSRYRGRFAPSPTGELHFGSMVAAVGSYLDAKAHHGQWIVRIEDIDTTRCRDSFSVSILRTLENFGFEWDGPVVYQSQRTKIYQEYFNDLKSKKLIYACTCTRRELAKNPKGIDGAPLYLGTCREKGNGYKEAAYSWRLKVDDQTVAFTDRIQGPQSQHLRQDVGDFVIRRADELFAYQLAVVVDDIEQKITDVIRGADLLDSTPRQIWLYRCLGKQCPRYAHLPLATNENDEKLSKQTLAPAIGNFDPVPLLLQVIRFLGIDLRTDNCSLDDFWKAAIAQWDINHVHQLKKIRLPQTKK